MERCRKYTLFLNTLPSHCAQISTCRCSSSARRSATSTSFWTWARPSCSAPSGTQPSSRATLATPRSSFQ
eukprot:9398656-Alexandrium_andersonii.AAC.1